MNELTWHDLQFALLRTPKTLLRVMKSERGANRIFVGGGFLRSIVAGETVNDVDVFVTSKNDATLLAQVLVKMRLRVSKADEKMTKEEKEKVDRKIYKTENALTLTCFSPTIQIIHRWTFGGAAGVTNSFDFTCCAAAFWWDGNKWQSVCDPRFYPDVASKRLIYRNPERNEEAGGSLLRVLKYYQKGYRIPLNCLADVIARLMRGIDLEKCLQDNSFCRLDEKQFSKVIAGLLREVDPNIDPAHVAHLPAEDTATEEPEAGNE